MIKIDLHLLRNLVIFDIDSLILTLYDVSHLVHEQMGTGNYYDKIHS